MSDPRRMLLVSIDGLAAPYLDDPSLDLPNLSAIRARGGAVARVTTPLPGVTWPCHTSLITGVSPARHGVLGNLVVDRRDGRPKEHLGDRAYDKVDLVAVPTLYDLAHAAGRRTAAVCWPQTRNAPTLDFTIPEGIDQAIFERYATPSLWRDLRGAGLPVGRYAAWSDSYVLAPMQDRLTGDATAHLIARHRPELLLVHFLALDCYQHQFGPGSPEARWALTYIDGELGRVLAALQKADLAAATTVVVTSDHGFTEVRTGIRTRVWLRQQGVWPGDVARAENGGVAGVTVLAERGRDELRERLARDLAGLPGVVAVYGPSDLPGLGLPDAGAHPHGPDLLLVAARDTYFDDGEEGDAVIAPAALRGTHGHPAGDDPWLHTAALAAGPGVAPGRVARAQLTEVGATAAALAGLAFPDAAAPLPALLQR
jgi:arylsulfatase A-like enzyme